MLQERALISSSFWKELLPLAQVCFHTLLLPTPSKPHPWETRRTSRRWRAHSSCSAIVAGTNKDHHSPNKCHPIMWLLEISRFLLDVMSHEGFWGIAQGWQLPPLTNHSMSIALRCGFAWVLQLLMFCPPSLPKSAIPHNHVAPPGCRHLSLSFNCSLRSAASRRFNDLNHYYKV